MSNFKKFKVSDSNDNEVVLEVDLNVLTPELCTEINDFWGGNKSRLQAESGDVVRAAIRLFGLYAIQYFMSDGGLELSGPIGEKNVYFTYAVLGHVHEGLPDFDHLGIVIFSVNVDVPTFDDLTLEEIL